MNKKQANDVLDRIRAGANLSLAITNHALQATGDLPRLRAHEAAHGEKLRSDGDERGFNRSCEVYGQEMGEGDTRIGWSRYLDSRENQTV